MKDDTWKQPVMQEQEAEEWQAAQKVPVPSYLDLFLGK